ncbi:MAG: hypothetical protein PF689_04575 [Deltaproteobacteria bacterium]|nr:hypothetical protein [Deltaproteobacteria bacterium]
MSSVTLSDDHSLIYEHLDSTFSHYYHLNLEEAGYVDSTGHVIPDPTYPAE